jgi:hypothetical protein
MEQCHGITRKRIQCKNKSVTGKQTCQIHCSQKFIDCGICLELINFKSPNTHKLLDCGHNFCNKCINIWIIEKYPKCSCPLCRDPITAHSRKFGNLTLHLAFKWGFEHNIIYEYTITTYPLRCLLDDEYILYKNIESEIFRTMNISVKNNTFRIFSIIANTYNNKIIPVLEKLKSKSITELYFKKIVNDQEIIKNYDLVI